MRTSTNRDWREWIGLWGWFALACVGVIGGVVLLVIAVGCAPPIPPPAPQPPPVIGYQMGATVRSNTGATLADVTATITPDYQAPIPCVFDVASSRLACPVPAGALHGDFDVSAPKFNAWHTHITFVANYDEIDLTPSFVPLPQLVPVGRTLRQIDGTHWTAIEASDFNLYSRFLNGEDIEPILEQRQHPDPSNPDAGFTLLRVWTAYNVAGIGRLVPGEHPDFYARIPEFLEHAANHRLYVEWTAFTGPYDGVLDGDDAKVAHWESLKAATCGQTGVAYLELVNEFSNPPNVGLPFDRLTKPTCPGLLASHGSDVQDSTPKQPYWDVVTYRPAAGETQRKAGHNAGELTGFGAPPVISNETQRFPDNDNDPNHAYDMAAGCVLLSMGCDFHSVDGKTSSLWTGDELRDAQAFASGARSVPLSCQDGAYENLGEMPGLGPSSRLYRTGGVDACTVGIRP